MFQSTPPRGGRHNRIYKFLIRIVSIHAPARGATVLDGSALIYNYVSIHAPARGATAYSESSWILMF